jgi:hypothetical protein
MASARGSRRCSHPSQSTSPAHSRPARSAWMVRQHESPPTSMPSSSRRGRPPPPRPCLAHPSQGTHPRVVMDVLGHSQIALTMNAYSHVMPSVLAEAADRGNPVRRSRTTATALHHESVTQCPRKDTGAPDERPTPPAANECACSRRGSPRVGHGAPHRPPSAPSVEHWDGQRAGGSRDSQAGRVREPRCRSSESSTPCRHSTAGSALSTAIRSTGRAAACAATRSTARSPTRTSC